MNPQTNKIHVIIPAAGVGSRMNMDIPKQYLDLAGRAVIEHSIATFASHTHIDIVHVGLSPLDRWFDHLAIARHPKIKTYVGGNERSDTVLNGLDHIPDDVDWVMVHDAARPGITPKLVSKLIEVVCRHGQGGLLAQPVRDTIKRSVDGCVSTLDRSELWLAQTPQMFPPKDLKRALLNALENEISITDEASAIEYLGMAPLLVEGDQRNLKLTTPDDLPLLAYLLEVPDDD